MTRRLSPLIHYGLLVLSGHNYARDGFDCAKRTNLEQPRGDEGNQPEIRSEPKL